MCRPVREGFQLAGGLHQNSPGAADGLDQPVPEDDGVAQCMLGFLVSEGSDLSGSGTAIDILSLWRKRIALGSLCRSGASIFTLFSRRAS